LGKTFPTTSLKIARYSLGRKKTKTIAFKKLQTHGFCGFVFMFLLPPTLEELKQSDLPDLVDMLSKQATEYSQLIKAEGITSKTIAIKELILNIQTVIDSKRSAEKKSVTG
jgi:hypothetical protein